MKSLTLGLDEGAEVLSVSALNREVRQLIEENLGLVWVEGEISNMARPASGHVYLTLKDETAQVRAAWFRQRQRGPAINFKNGDKVLAYGRVSLYEARGDYQLIADTMEAAGEGRLRAAWEALADAWTQRYSGISRIDDIDAADLDPGANRLLLGWDNALLPSTVRAFARDGQTLELNQLRLGEQRYQQQSSSIVLVDTDPQGVTIGFVGAPAPQTVEQLADNVETVVNEASDDQAD